MDIGRRIKDRRIEIGETLESIAIKIGKTIPTVQRYESGEIKNIGLDVIESLAIALRCSPAYLLGWENSIRSTKGNLVPVPLLGKIPAGVPIEILEADAEFIDTPEYETKDGQYFYLKVTGDSMIGSRIYDGDLVFVRKQADIESGEVAVVRVNSHEATLKRVKKFNGKVILYPDNPNYEPIIINSSDAEIIGKVIKVEFSPNRKY